MTTSLTHLSQPVKPILPKQPNPLLQEAFLGWWAASFKLSNRQGAPLLSEGMQGADCLPMTPRLLPAPRPGPPICHGV